MSTTKSSQRSLESISHCSLCCVTLFLFFTPSWLTNFVAFVLSIGKCRIMIVVGGLWQSKWGIDKWLKRKRKVVIAFNCFWLPLGRFLCYVLKTSCNFILMNVINAIVRLIYGLIRSPNVDIVNSGCMSPPAVSSLSYPLFSLLCSSCW